MGLDLAVLRLVAAHRPGWLTALATAVAEVGMSTAAYVVAAVLCVAFAVLFRAWRPAVAAPVAAVVAIAVADAAKGLIGRPRPPEDLALLTTGGFAMPSSIGAMTAAAALPVVLYGLRRGDRIGRVLAVVLGLATLGVGVSMVYLGAHWLTDVLAGWALGAVIAIGVSRVLAGPIRRTAQGPGPSRPDHAA